MKKIIIFTVISILILGCATSERRAEKESVRETINKSYAKVNIILLDSPKWCSYKKYCKYIRDIDCRVYSKSKEMARKDCDKKMATDSLKAGGDTFVYQVIKKEFQFAPEEDEMKIGNTDAYLAYGQTYRCTGEFDSISKKYMKKRSVHPKYRVQITTSKNEKRCDADTRCKFVRTFKCSTTRAKSETRCFRKVKKTMRGTDINKLVIKKEVAADDKYSVSIDGYQCDIESLK